MNKGNAFTALAVMVGICAAAFAAAAQQSDIAKWDPRMAQQNAVVDGKGVKWIDDKMIPYYPLGVYKDRSAGIFAHSQEASK